MAWVLRACAERASGWCVTAANWVRDNSENTITKIRAIELHKVITNVGRLSSLAVAFQKSDPIVAMTVGLVGFTISEVLGYGMALMKGDLKSARSHLPKSLVLCSLTTLVTSISYRLRFYEIESKPSVDEFLSACQSWCGCPGFETN